MNRLPIGFVLTGLSTLAIFATSALAQTPLQTAQSDNEDDIIIVASGKTLKPKLSTRLSKVEESFYCESNKLSATIISRHDNSMTGNFQETHIQININNEELPLDDVKKNLSSQLGLSSLGLDFVCLSDAIIVKFIAYDNVPKHTLFEVDAITVNLADGSVSRP